MGIILQKFISESGLCSRRKAGELIKQGKVKVNNKVAMLGTRVHNGDKVEIDEKVIEQKKEKILIKLNKPTGYTCTNRKFKDEKNIFELIDLSVRLFVIGRLDKDSRGLVLLTNDGNLAQKWTHPKYEHEKEYEIIVKCRKSNVEFAVKRLKQGVDIGEGDGVVKAKEVKYLGNNKFKLILTQGKKRQIRRMFKALGLKIKDLKRIRIGEIKLGNLREGKWKKINY